MNVMTYEESDVQGTGLHSHTDSEHKTADNDTQSSAKEICRSKMRIGRTERGRIGLTSKRGAKKSTTESTCTQDGNDEGLAS